MAYKKVRTKGWVLKNFLRRDMYDIRIGLGKFSNLFHVHSTDGIRERVCEQQRREQGQQKGGRGPAVKISLDHQCLVIWHCSVMGFGIRGGIRIFYNFFFFSVFRLTLPTLQIILLYYVCFSEGTFCWIIDIALMCERMYDLSFSKCPSECLCKYLM